MKNEVNNTYGIVTFDSAMLLRKIGYDKPVNYVYHRNNRKKIGWNIEVPDRIVFYNANEYPYAFNELSAPSTTEVNEWLLNKYGMKIFTIPAEYTNKTHEFSVLYNKVGNDFIYEYRVYLTPLFYNDESFAKFIEDYLDTNLIEKTFKTELDAFECGLKTICNAIIEYNKSKK